jgi:phosphoserine phosphatase
MKTIPYDAVVFDCDGTLSQLEGIVELAHWNGVLDQVQTLTEKAMSLTGMSADIYRERIQLTRPTWEQCERLATAYNHQRTPDINTVIHALQQQNIALYIVSAGVNPSVTLFAQHLNIEKSHVFAVDLSFDATGQYTGYDTGCPMTRASGKRLIVKKIQETHPNIAYVGDGQNDMDVYNDVARFVGYGGAFYRKAMDEQCAFYIREPSMLSLLDILAASK